jgi:hypothetical protein
LGRPVVKSTGPKFLAKFLAKILGQDFWGHVSRAGLAQCLWLVGVELLLGGAGALLE